jgi:hypothetical protein
MTEDGIQPRRVRAGGLVILLCGAVLLWIGVFLYTGVMGQRLAMDGAGLAGLADRRVDRSLRGDWPCGDTAIGRADAPVLPLSGALRRAEPAPDGGTGKRPGQLCNNEARGRGGGDPGKAV